MAKRKYKPEVIDRICELLVEGKSLREICALEGMPDRVTVWRWGQADDETAMRIREAWEVGYVAIGEEIFDEVRRCEDPQKARAILEAGKWFLGKRSAAYREKPLAQGLLVNVGADDAFDAVARLLDQAAATRASSGDSTREVGRASETGPADPGRRLADLAGSGGERLGEDADGS